MQIAPSATTTKREQSGHVTTRLSGTDLPDPLHWSWVRATRYFDPRGLPGLRFTGSALAAGLGSDLTSAFTSGLGSTCGGLGALGWGTAL